MHRGITGARLIAATSVLATIAACSDQSTAPLTGFESKARSVASGTPTGRYVVVFRDTSAIPADGLALVAAVGGTISRQWDDIGVAFVSGLSPNAITALAASDVVAAVGGDRILSWLPRVRVGGTTDAGVVAQARGEPGKARYMADGSQWGPRLMRADAAWAAGHLGTSSTRVAILDTGLDYDHRELKGLVDLAASRSFSDVMVAESGFAVIAPEPQQPGDLPFMDNHFHGTHVGATVASNNISVAGVAPNVTLIAVKVLNFLGSGSFESVASGIRHAADAANADVINMSLGADVDANEEGVDALLEMMRRVIRDAEKKGAIVISAAGNDAINLDYGTVVSTPCEQSTLCISATGPLLQQNFDQAATYTNFGITAIEVAAPGGNFVDGDDSAYQTEDLVIGACSRRASSATLNVCRANNDGVVYFYAWAAGTSMASPHAAGAAALVKSANPTLSVKGLARVLMRTADDVQEGGRDVFSNWGRINVARALGIE